MALKFIRRGAQLAACLLLWGGYLSAADAQSITSTEKWHCVRAGREASLGFSSEREIQAATWSLKVGGRTTAQQSAIIEGKVARAVFEIPETKDGPVAASLEMNLQFDGDDSMDTSHALYVYPPNLLARRQKQLSSLQLAVFDPVGDTHKALKDTVPFKHCRNLAACRQLTEGILIVGEGVDWNRQRGLSELASQLPERGVAILALAPKIARFPFPSAMDEWPALDEVYLKGSRAIQSFDERWDTSHWQGGPSQRSGLRFSFKRGLTGVQSKQGQPGWSWYQLNFDGPKPSTFVCCGFGIIDQWSEGPMSELLLLEVLQSLSDRQKAKAVSTVR